jgi:hypothetical protein
MKTSTTSLTHVAPRGLALSALALAVTLLTQTAQAATDEELQSIKLYGNVTIAQDSPSSWGPWGAFENLPGMPPMLSREPIIPTFQKDLYRPLPQTQEVGGCAGGSICGFGFFTGYDASLNPARLQPQSMASDGDYHPIQMVGTVVQPGSGQYELPSAIPDVLSIHTTLLSSTGSNLIFPQSGDLTLNSVEGSYIDYDRSSSTDTHNERFRLTGYLSTNLASPSDTYVIDVWGDTRLQDYIAGTGDTESYWHSRYNSFEGYMGLTTTDQDMAALRGSHATATYQGYDYSNSRVDLEVNFGNSTWSGSWNNGVDGSVSTYTSDTGHTVLDGRVGFTAQGTISGVNLTSTSVAASDATAISGFVKGAFFGPQAAAVAGVVDITKSRAQPQMNPMRLTPAVNIGGYTNARFVSPFIAVRPELIRD